MPVKTDRNDDVEKAIIESRTILEANLHNLNLRDRAFATSLLYQLDSRGLTDKQLYWFAKLMHRSVQTE
jgi:hypothetical protein